MPVTLVDRLPLPNLKVYSAGSVLLLSVAMYYAVSVTSDPNWKANATLQRQEAVPANVDSEGVKMVQPPAIAQIELPMNGTKNFSDQALEVVTFMMQEPLCMWTLINMAYCSLALFGFFIQRLVFGRLRVAEAQRVKDKFWNYLFYKFIFVFGVLNVQYMDEVLLWCSWFTLVGFLHLLGQLCKDRFDYDFLDSQLSSSPSAARWAHTRLLGLLIGILAAASALFVVAIVWGLPAGKDTFAFMAAECLLVAVSALHVLARFTLRAHDADAAGPAAYYTHLAFDALALVTETVHVAHMVVYSNVVVSMASLVLLMQLRHLLHALLARLRRHRLYCALADHMSRNYPMASEEEVLKHEDNCAICWEPMKEARKLPCSHLFHNSCLCRWVQQDASCPTCRRALSAAPEPPRATHPLAPLAPLTPLAPLATLAAEARREPRHNHLFHFDGSRYVSWLPSFSVEVTRVREGREGRGGRGGREAEEALAAQVQRLFPQYTRDALLADLAVTRSAHLTIDNILEGRLPLPPVVETPEAASEATRAPADGVLFTFAETLQGTSSDENAETAETADGGSGGGGGGGGGVGGGGGQFSGLAAEREAALRRRKDELLAAARARFLRRCPAAAPAPGPCPSS